MRWWQIPELASAQAVLTTRRMVLCAATAVIAGWGTYVGFTQITQNNSPTFGLYLFILFFVGRWLSARIITEVRHPTEELQPGFPRAIRPRWPRDWGEWSRLLGAALLLGLGILPTLVKLWTAQAAGLPGATPAGSYRSDRSACLLKGLAWAPAGLLVGALPAWGTGALPESMAAHGLLAVVLGMLLSGPYPLLRFSELVVSADWDERVRFLPLLEHAADRGVVRRDSDGYEFRDDALFAYLIVRGQAALDDQAKVRAGRLARMGIRAALVRSLTQRGRARVCVDGAVGIGVGAAIAFGIFLAGHGGVVWGSGGHAYGWALVPVGAVIGVLAGGLAAGLLFWSLPLVASTSAMALAHLPRTSRGKRLATALVAAAAVAVLIAGASTVLAKIIAYVLPAALVVACGTWAVVLASRRTHALPRRWQRAAPDVIAAATSAAGLLLLIDHRLLAAAPAAGLLFPAGAWGSILLWRWMNRSKRLAVRAGADLVLSLLLGGIVVLLLVWLANILAMPRAEVALLRTVLGQAGALADLPWWAWTSCWLLLAVASLAFVRWPDKLKQVARQFARLRVVAATNVSERVLSAVHVALLALVLVGVAAPPALTPTLSRQLRTTYEAAFQRRVLDQGELTAYREIARTLTGQPTSRVLTALVTKLHDVSPPDDEEASAIEVENARRLGEAEALALALGPSAALTSKAQEAAADAGISGSAPHPGSLTERAATVQEQEKKVDETGKQVETAADTAARVVASLISIPRLSTNEIVQVVRAYLAGLIEESPLKDTFAAWIERLPGSHRPPDPEAEVFPAPERLEQAATAQLSAEFSAAGDDDPVTDPFVTDQALGKARAEDPLDAAVDTVNQARYAQDQSGTCTGCAVPGNSDENQPGEQPPEDNPEEP